MKEWINCERRGPFARNSLKRQIDDLRNSANAARRAYRKDYMGDPCKYIADAYDEAADTLQKRLDIATDCP